MNEEEKKAIEDMNGFANGIDMSCVNARQMQIVLNLIVKLQKENEELREEKEQAWEEWNNLEQGSYETEQKLKQQIKELQKENEELNLKYRMLYAGKFENMKAQEIKIRSQVIPVQKVKDKIEELEAQYKTALEENSTTAFILKCQITILQELIEEREEK